MQTQTKRTFKNKSYIPVKEKKATSKKIPIEIPQPSNQPSSEALDQEVYKYKLLQDQLDVETQKNIKQQELVSSLEAQLNKLTVKVCVEILSIIFMYHIGRER